jgi:hypothetical protein
MGTAALVLGVIALLVFFLPPLGIPIGGFGLLLGIAGFIAALISPSLNIRWSVAGIFVCVMALGVNYAISYAPPGEYPGHNPPATWNPVSDRPYVPPPSQGGPP